MANYSDIKGFTVQTLSSDTAASAAATGSWSSGGSTNQVRSQAAGSGVSSDAALIFGGYTGSAATGKTESYDGSSWTELNDLGTARRYIAGCGTYTAALCTGGSPSPAINEQWDGTSWTEVGDLNTGRGDAGEVGTTAAALYFGGEPVSALTELWNGSSWTEVNDLNTARFAVTGFGTSTAAVAANGREPSVSSSAEDWDGTSWTASGNLNTARGDASASQTAPSTDGIIFIGSTGNHTNTVTNTEAYNGTSWTEVSDLSQKRYRGMGGGTGASAICATGYTGTARSSVTEEWATTATPTTLAKITEGQLFFNSTANAFKETITDIPGATWASSGNLNEGRGNAGSSGTQTATLFFGGEPPGGSQSALTEQYDGSSWTEVGDLNVARGQQFFSNQGTQTAALSATGVPLQTSVESWNGSAWTETTDLNTARRNGSSLGTQGAMLGTGGYASPSYRTLTEIWDGSSWTETGDCPDAKFVCRGGGGTTTAGIIAGNYPNGDIDSSQTWDGTSWTNGPNINTGRSGIAFSAQTQSSALGHGGGTGTPQAAQTKTEFFNGTSWTELNDLSTASQQGGGAGSSVLGIHMGGYPGVSATEEWTAGLANKTITAS